MSAMPTNFRNAGGVVAVAAGTLLLVAAMLLKVGSSQLDEAAWISEFLNADEIRHVKQLSSRIVQLRNRSDRPVEEARLQDTVRELSIREVAALGLMLLDTDHVEIVPWIRLAAEREQQSRARLQLLMARFHDTGPKYPGLQTTVRGPRRLRTICGDELLTEVTGTGFRIIDDDGFSLPADLDDESLQVLLHLPGLEWIWIEYGRLTDAGVAQLAKLPRLKEIHLVDCRELTDASLGSLATPRMQQIDLGGGIGISDAGVANVTRCPNLKTLRLDRTCITSASLPLIARCESLTELSLSRTAVCDGLEQLRTLNQLERLELGGLGTVAHPVPWKSLRFLSDCKDLSSLDLNETVVQRVELRQLPHLNQFTAGHSSLVELELIDLPRLQEFRMNWCPAPDAMHMDHVVVRGVTDLRRLSLYGLSIQACDSLASSLTDSSHLETVSLRNSPMTDSLAMALGHLTELKSLNIHAADVSSRQQRSILSSRGLRYLSCGGARLTADDWSTFSKSGLTTLEIETVNLSNLGELAPWPVESLILKECRIGQLMLNDLSELKSIDLSQVQIDNLRVTDCPQLKQFNLLGKTIETLHVDSCPRLKGFFTGGTKLGLLEFSDLPQLQEMVIQERSSVQKLRIDELPKLTSVSFWAADVSVATIEALIGTHSLAHLDISGTRLGDDTARTISRLTGLRHLSASPCFTRMGLEQLQDLPKLHSIYLYRRGNADWSSNEVRQLLPQIRESCVFDAN